MKQTMFKISFTLLLAGMGLVGFAQVVDTSGGRTEPTYDPGTHNTTYPDGSIYMPHDNSNEADNQHGQLRLPDGKVIDCVTNEADCAAAMRKASGYALQNAGSGNIPVPKLSKIPTSKGKMTPEKRARIFDDIRKETESLQSQKKGVYVLRNGKWEYVANPTAHTEAIISRLKALKAGKGK